MYMINTLWIRNSWSDMCMIHRSPEPEKGAHIVKKVPEFKTPTVKSGGSGCLSPNL